MPISEAARSDLYTGLSEVLGPERAETLMSAIPRYDLDEVATKGDIASSHAVLKGDIAEMRAELSGDIGDLRVELKGDIGELRAELKGDIGELRAEFKSDFFRLTLVLLAGFLGVIATLIGVS